MGMGNGHLFAKRGRGERLPIHAGGSSQTTRTRTRTTDQRRTSRSSSSTNDDGVGAPFYLTYRDKYRDRRQETENTPYLWCAYAVLARSGKARPVAVSPRPMTAVDGGARGHTRRFLARSLVSFRAENFITGITGALPPPATPTRRWLPTTRHPRKYINTSVPVRSLGAHHPRRVGPAAALPVNRA